MLINDLTFLLDLLGNSEWTKLLIWKVIFVWCLLRQRNGGWNSGQKPATIVTDACTSSCTCLSTLVCAERFLIHWTPTNKAVELYDMVYPTFLRGNNVNTAIFSDCLQDSLGMGGAQPTQAGVMYTIFYNEICTFCIVLVYLSHISRFMERKISLFHELIYDIAQWSILIGLDIAVYLWRHTPRRWRVFRSKICNITRSKCVFLAFLRVLHVITRWEFYISSPEARGYKTNNSFHKYRMKWKFISDPIFITYPLWIFVSSSSLRGA